ncbi:MAG: hypothetical protein R6X14_02535, partial [bacterium]
MKRILLAVAILGASAYPRMVAYEANPVKAAWSGKVWPTLPQGGVGQSFVACFDSIEAVHLFIGTHEGDAEYQVTIGEPGGSPIMTSFPVAATKGHYWLEFTDWQAKARFTKGKTYTALFTRTSGQDSLAFYYDSTDAYQWGSIILPGQQAPIPDPRDLAARVHGRNTPLDSLRWGSHVRTLTALMPAKPFGGWGDSSGGRARAACAAEAGIRLDRDYVSMHVLWPDGCPERTDPTLCFLPAL